MEYAPADYSRHYIVQALFKLMNEHEYEKIGVTEIAEKAGVGRATFYRYFKRKDDVIEFYFTHNTREFISGQHYYPRCKADYIRIARDVFAKFERNKDCFRLILRAHREYLYLEFLNRMMLETFREEYPKENPLKPYLFAGMLFNVSIAWLKNDCAESVDTLADAFIETINISGENS